jgi:hypothetical protein
MQELFMAIAEIRKEIRENKISTNITHRQWGDFGANSKKRPCPLDLAGTLDTILWEPC